MPALRRAALRDVCPSGHRSAPTASGHHRLRPVHRLRLLRRSPVPGRALKVTPTPRLWRRQMANEAKRTDPARASAWPPNAPSADRIDFTARAHGLMPGRRSRRHPACANACIASALTFGDIDDAARPSRLLRRERAFPHARGARHGPGFFYLWEKSNEPGVGTRTAALLGLACRGQLHRRRGRRRTAAVGRDRGQRPRHRDRPAALPRARLHRRRPVLRVDGDRSPLRALNVFFHIAHLVDDPQRRSSPARCSCAASSRCSAGWLFFAWLAALIGLVFPVQPGAHPRRASIPAWRHPSAAAADRGRPGSPKATGMLALALAAARPLARRRVRHPAAGAGRAALLAVAARRPSRPPGTTPLEDAALRENDRHFLLACLAGGGAADRAFAGGCFRHCLLALGASRSPPAAGCSGSRSIPASPQTPGFARSTFPRHPGYSHPGVAG